ncbi:hypothetical protein A3715_34530 [Oleiphilus sp. HI0009]|uniref:hypothetical protein n=2 Tax=Oleiphilus TaxID=141450 RepID=UPI0007C39D36|nr:MULTISPECIES: hypothetical protein [unclassified Oleiphilus]KZX78981.1 hypothetical protein A3715_09155 [Oleiphilus sp. HI0009]MCH2159424.1 hypothetical protein [Oleiphilaceae bacterium]KZX81927.1 hypothetical protein A3715_34530 [Oleiphilus sp. HI0009]KZY65064.1 hypothetical protein A3738_18700 [Oleiphilus sp. HI0066]KZY66003.1 hypothetical protein A3738_00660 [Oleiphilus sp. HI0066]
METRFKLFFVFSALLLISLSGLTYAEFYMEDSVQQELIGLVSLIAAALSIFGVVAAYVMILWQRLKRFFTTDTRR